LLGPNIYPLQSFALPAAPLHLLRSSAPFACSGSPRDKS
jgi:hypothetical protein